MKSAKGKEERSRIPLVAVVFDLDGTLVDSSDIKLHAYFEAMRRHAGGNHIDHVRAYARHGTRNRVEQLRLAFADVVERPPSDAESAALTAAYTAFCRKYFDKIRVIDGFDEFRRNNPALRLAIASNAPQEEVEELCNQLGVSKYFERLYGYPTSKIDALRAVITDWGLRRTQVLYVGDRPEDGIAADAAGVWFRLIDHTGRARYGNDHLVRSFRELGAAVEKLEGGPAA